MEIHETETFTRRHSVENGIERVTYLPRQRRFDTPILFQHGMWHGAWCWQWWQELFAGWGWESHAFSLPGHAGSPPQRPVRFCTLGYYLRFLQAEVQRLPRRPALVGHSMGGALAQWYLKYVGDDLPAVVLLAAWSALGNFTDGVGGPFFKLDPVGFLKAAVTLSAQPFVRNPERAAALLISPRGVYSPQEFHAHLSPESLWVMSQHVPPLWRAPSHLKTPLLVIAAEQDAAISVKAQRRSAAAYGAELVVIPQAAHNLMMEHNLCETARLVCEWLETTVRQ